MAELLFDDGLKTYSINGKCELRFNPTDNTFIEKLHDTFEKLEGIQNKYKAEAESEDLTDHVFEFSRQKDKEMREILDELFNAPVCDKIFGDMNVYSLAGGVPVWCNLLLAIMDEVEKEVTSQTNSKNSGKIAKYLEKYKKYQK
jgi:hypothetical protein